MQILTGTLWLWDEVADWNEMVEEMLSLFLPRPDSKMQRAHNISALGTPELLTAEDFKRSTPI